MNGFKLLATSTFIAVCVAATGCQQAAPQAAPADPWGEVVVSPGQTIKINLAMSQADPSMGPIGTEQLRGAQLAARQFDSIQGFRVSLEVSDPACSNDGGANAANQAVGSAQTVGVIGMTCSVSCFTSAPILDKAHIVDISPSCEATALTDQVSHRDVFLTTSYGAIDEGEIAGDFAFKELGARRIAVISYGDLETDDIVKAFETRVQNLGATIASSSTVVRGQFTFSSALNQAKNGRADLIYAPLLPTDAARLVFELQHSALSTNPLLGGRYYISSWFAGKAGETAGGIYAVGPNIDSPSYHSAVEAYRGIYGEEPTSSELAFSYDAMRMLLQGINKVAVIDADNNLNVGRKALRDTLFQTADYQGVTGNITCTAWGDCGAAHTIAVAQLRSGQWANVFIP